MTFLSIICVVLFSCVLLAGFRLRGPQGDALISSYKIVLGLLFLYMLLPSLLLLALNGGHYVWLPEMGGAYGISITSIACTVAAVVFICGYSIRLRSKPLIIQRKQLCNRGSRVLAGWLIAVGVLIKLYIWIASGGVETNIVRLSAGVRENLGVESISGFLVVLRYFSGVADAGATWLLLERMQSRKKILPVAILFGLVIGLTFFSSGKRLFLLWPILAALVGTHHYVRPIRAASLPAIGAFLLGLGFLSLMFRVYAPAFVAGVEIDLNEVAWAQGSLLKFYFFSLEFASFEMLTFALEESDRVVGLFGSALNAFYITNIQPFAYFVPRFVWPEKPSMFIDLSHAYRVFVTGGMLDSSGGVAATILGTSWTLGGPVGFLLTMLGLGRLSRLLDGNSRLRGLPRPVDICWYAFGLVTIFHLFRQGTLAWTAIIVLVQQSGLIIGFVALAIAGRGVTLSRRARHCVGVRSGGLCDRGPKNVT